MNKQSFLAVLTAAIITGFSGVFIKTMAINPASQAWLRMGVPTIVTAIWMLSTGTPFLRGNWKKMVLTSVLCTVRILLFFAAFTNTSIGNAIIVFYTFPIFSAIFGYFFLKENITSKQKILLFIAFLGIILAFSDKEFSFKNEDFIGITAALLSAIVHAITVVLFKSESTDYTRTELLFYQNFVGFLILAPFFQFATATVTDYSLGISYGLLVGTVGYGLFFYGLKKLKASTTTALMYMEVVSAVIFGYFFFNEQLSLFTILGGALIIGSSFLLGKND